MATMIILGNAVQYTIGQRSARIVDSKIDRNRNIAAYRSELEIFPRQHIRRCPHFFAIAR
jgi:hypothetical protein